MPDHKFTVALERDERGLYMASVPLLQGCYTQRETYEETLEQIKYAIRLHIEARQALIRDIRIHLHLSKWKPCRLLPC